MPQVPHAVPLALLLIGFSLPLVATGDQEAAKVLTLAPDALHRFKDCSTGFWFDQKGSWLRGKDFEVRVPAAAVTKVRDGYVRIATKSQISGFSTEWLFVPGFNLDSGGSQQNSVAVVGQIEGIRQALERTWGLSFVKGMPEGPEPSPKAVAYFADPPKARPALNSVSQSSKRTTIDCPVQLASRPK